MSQYHHHPDGLVYVRTLGAIYCDTIENFRLDFDGTWPLETGVSEINYDDTQKRHRRFDHAGNHLSDGIVPFLFGDAAIAGIDALLKNQAARMRPNSATPAKAPTEATLKPATPSAGTRAV